MPWISLHIYNLQKKALTTLFSGPERWLKWFFPSLWSLDSAPLGEADGVGPPYRHRVRNGRQHGDLSVAEMNGMRKFGVFEWFRETGSLAIVGKLWKAKKRHPSKQTEMYLKSKYLGSPWKFLLFKSPFGWWTRRLRLKSRFPPFFGRDSDWYVRWFEWNFWMPPPKIWHRYHQNR